MLVTEKVCQASYSATDLALFSWSANHKSNLGPKTRGSAPDERKQLMLSHSMCGQQRSLRKPSLAPDTHPGVHTPPRHPDPD